MLPELQIYHSKQSMLKGLIGQLSQDEIHQVIDNVNNSIYWLIGHLTGARISMLKILGIPYEANIDLQYFKKGASGNKHFDGPEFSELINHFDRIGDLFYNSLSESDAEVLNKPMKYVISEKMVTVGDNLRFLIFHEDYHIGQVALIIRMMGKKGIGV